MQKVETFWRRHWPSSEDLADKQDTLDSLYHEYGLGDQVRHPDMPPLSGSDLKRTLAHQRGKAAGPEGWRPEELWNWPAPALDLLAAFLNKIERGHSWPKALMQWRQVHLSKPNKPAGELGSLRPNSIGAAVYRLWSATRIRQLGPWLLRRFPNQVHGGLPGRGVHSALLEPLAELEAAQRSPQGSLRFVGSSDLSKAFDAMHGSLSAGALRRLGVPRPLCDAWHRAWNAQERILQLAGSCSKRAVTEVMALPQGDPASPAALTAPLVESLRRIQSIFAGRRHGRSMFRLFLDDRSWFCEKRKTCLDIGREWLREVTIWGLRENKSKADFGVVGSVQERRRMQAELGRREQVGEVKLRPRLLGTSLQLNRAHGKPAKEESQSLDKARQMADWGRHLPGDQARKAKFLKATAIGAIGAPSYVRLETLRELNKLQTKVSGAYRTSGHQRGGLLHLLLDGHAACVRYRHGVVATMQVLLYGSLQVLRRAWGASRTNGPLGLVRRWLARHGWLETGPWGWRHPLTGCHLAVNSSQVRPAGNTVVLASASKDQLGHALREAWRAHTWEAWLRLGRLRGVTLPRMAWDEVGPRLKLLRSARDALPRELQSHATAVATGHAVSQAAWASMNRIQCGPCWFCNCSARVPTLAHVLWHCSAFNSTRVQPKDQLERELCWPSAGQHRVVRQDSSEWRQASALLRHGAMVRMELLSRRLREGRS